VTRRLFVLFAALALFVPVAACGGDDDDTSADETEEESTTDDEVDDEEEADDEEEEESAGGGDDFADALERAADATIKVTYEITDGGEDADEFTIAQDPPRFALTSQDTLLIDDGERLITCETSEDGQCVELPREGSGGMAQSILSGFAAPFVAFQAAATAGIAAYEVTGEDEIAGRDAVCATIEASELPGSSQSGSLRSCIDKETGILLLFEGEDESGGETTRIEAVDVGEPTDDDFEPTSDPISVGG